MYKTIIFFISIVVMTESCQQHSVPKNSKYLSISADTILCTYYGACSEILPNAQGKQKVLIPAIRAELKKLHDGADEDFDSFLIENFFDLHYQASRDAQAIKLGLGHICRLAIDHPETKVLPCLHCAPKETNGKIRLLLIC